jgi:hypothetical protein
LEGARVRTRSSLDLPAMRARTDAVGLLVREIDAASADRLADRVKQYCAAMLNRANSLRAVLGEDHPAVRAAVGELPPDLLERAKDLLLARLAQGG